MGDLGEMWRDHKESVKQEKRKRLEVSRHVLGKLKIDWIECTPNHWKLLHRGIKIDFWPTTHNWHWPGEKRTNIGLNALLNHMGYQKSRKRK